ncbi:MAG: glycosyl hydrolase family 2 [Chlamydiia bacterium]|nr:glycosyl hydrolase family 2 [Chlamydiia bacterium]
MKKIAFALLSVMFLFSCTQEQDVIKLEVQGLFTNHMVIQRDDSLKVKGWATPNQLVKVETTWGANAESTSSEQGEWLVNISTPSAGGPFEMKIISTDSIIQINDILSGEVWVASGQSNMEMPLKGWGDTINNADFEIKNANYPNIRILTVAKTVSFTQEENLKSEWVVASPETASKFSAAAYFFARKLNTELNVPVGIISSAWGGTPVESWLTVEKIKDIKGFDVIATGLTKAKEQYPTFLEWTKSAEYVDINELKKKGNAFDLLEIKHKEYTSLDFSDASWGSIDPSEYWESQDVGNFDGMVWYRKEFTLENVDSLKVADLYLGPINDMDITYINGYRVGSKLGVGFYNVPRDYEIPKGILKVGKNVIALRVLDFAGEGGIYRDNDKDITISQSGNEIANLSEGWKYKSVATILSSSNVYWMNDENPMPPLDVAFGPHTPTLLYNGMISPLTDYTIKGVIWYQGESNVGRASAYHELFSTMIKGWRNNWEQGDFPFYFVQIAPFDYNSGFLTSELREAQRSTLSLPNTGMAVTMDIASLETIHPGNKQDIGLRLAYWALKDAYKTEQKECSGPLFESAILKNNIVSISFTHIVGGLVLKNEDSKTFEVAGSDKVFYAAKYKVVDGRVEVWSNKVKEPVEVRYLWTDFIEPNLFNGSGLPASPFIHSL